MSVRLELDFDLKDGVTIVSPLGPEQPRAVFCGDEEHGIPRKGQILLRMGGGHHKG